MIGDNAKRMICENLHELEWSRNLYVNLTGAPLIENESGIDNPHVRILMFYGGYVTYNTRHHKTRKNDTFVYSLVVEFRKPKGAVKFKDMEELKRKAAEDEEVAFILKYYRITDRILALAKMNPETWIPIQFDAEAWSRHLEEEDGEWWKLNPYKVYDKEEGERLR